MTDKNNFYITHIVVPKLIEKGFDQLFYYTTKDKTLKDGKFYWGRGNNSFDKEFIDELLARNRLQKLNTKEYPFFIKESESLFIDGKGDIYKVGSFLPLIFKKKIGKLEVEVKK